MKVIRNHGYAYRLTNGSAKIGSLTNISYYELVKAIGRPTFEKESDDGKVQVEWVVKFKKKVFTIHDWKTFDREFTKEELKVWTIGGVSENANFVSELKDELFNKIYK